MLYNTEKRFGDGPKSAGKIGRKKEMKAVISQTVLDGYFAMIMLVEIGGMKESSFHEFSAALKKIGEESAVDIRVMHEDIFNSMHRI